MQIRQRIRRATSLTVAIVVAASLGGALQVAVCASNPRPSASADSYTVGEGATLTVAIKNGVLANDSGTWLNVVSHTEPAHGRLVVAPGGSFIYTPAPGFSGIDTFTYTMSEAVQAFPMERTTLTSPESQFGVDVYSDGYGSSIRPVPGAPGEFYGLTDRGPNVDGVPGSKIFPMPDYTPRIGRFRLEGGRARLLSTILLKDAAGAPRTGRAIPAAGGAAAIESVFDINDNALPPDPNGLDPEGLVALADGTFWTSDEYGPFLTHFDATGRTLEQVSPWAPNAQGRQLPKVLAMRRANRGMEGLTVTPDGRTLVGIMQSPLMNDIGSRDTGKTALVRIVTFAIATGETHQYAYLLEDPGTYGTSVSEIAALSSTEFLVDERDDFFPGASTSPAQIKKIWRISLKGATDIGAAFGSNTLDPAKGLLIGGTTTLEKLVMGQNTTAATATLSANGITTVGKTLELDLLGLLRTLDPSFEYFAHDKLEGLAVIDGGHKLVVSSDSDFGVAALANAVPPFTLRAKVVPTTGNVDTGDVLVVDLKRLSSPPSTATVAIRVVAASSAVPTTRQPNEVPATRSSGPRG